MKHTHIAFIFLCVLIVVSSGSFIIGRQTSRVPTDQLGSQLLTNIIPSPEPERPLLAYTFPSLQTTDLSSPQIEITKPELATSTPAVIPDGESSEPIEVLFSYTTQGKKMSGLMLLPPSIATSSAQVPMIIMIRGWVPAGVYEPGVGTKNAALTFARAGYVTLAPDFFGYGSSDPEPTDEWQARFEKPLTVLELINGLRAHGISGLSQVESTLMPSGIGIWGHSNGGQIALSALTISGESIPTVLWAPVTAPFPYSILYFSDEEADEGQMSRRWISHFDRLYDAREFSFTNYLSTLHAPLQLHHGSNDDAALKWWSDEFTAKLDQENVQRAASRSADRSSRDNPSLQPIDYEYFVYQGADHNLRPSWDLAVTRSLNFFKEEVPLE